MITQPGDVLRRLSKGAHLLDINDDKLWLVEGFKRQRVHRCVLNSLLFRGQVVYTRDDCWRISDTGRKALRDAARRTREALP